MHEAFTAVSTQTAAFYAEQCTSPSLQTSKSHEVAILSLLVKNYGFIGDAIFFT